jgi:hypothetical protein
MVGVNLQTPPSSATRYEDCLRRCEACGLGASNATNSETVTYIYRDPLENIPIEIRDGAESALSNAFNIRNRPSKRRRFGFSSSEDAVTWVVFAYLLRSGLLGECLHHAKIISRSENLPSLLLWGTAVDDSGPGGKLRERLQILCRRLKEDPQSFSEPDVIVDLGAAGLVFIEVKYRSGNDAKAHDYPGWSRYFPEAGLPWNETEVRASGCYELARNWRLLNGLAEGRPTTLVNLGPSRLFSGTEGARLDRFVSALREDANSSFAKLTWTELLAGVRNSPAWFSDYCRDRKLNPKT